MGTTLLRTNFNSSDLVEVPAPSIISDEIVLVLDSRDIPAGRISYIIQNVGEKIVSLYRGSWDGTNWTINTAPFAILVPNNLGSYTSPEPCAYHGPIYAGVADEYDTTSGYLLVSESY